MVFDGHITSSTGIPNSKECDFCGGEENIGRMYNHVFCEKEECLNKAREDYEKK